MKRRVVNQRLGQVSRRKTFNMKERDKKISKWDIRFLRLADHISTWSKDPHKKVGCVIVDEFKRVVSIGYNGFPTGVQDNDMRYNDREVKRLYVAHAEQNALNNRVSSVRGYTLYCQFYPCNECTKSIISSGIKRVVTTTPLMDNPVDRYHWRESILMFTEARVQVDTVDWDKITVDSYNES